MKLFLKCLTLMTLLALFCCAFVCAEASGDPDVTVIASGECGAEGDNLTSGSLEWICFLHLLADH